MWAAIALTAVGCTAATNGDSGGPSRPATGSPATTSTSAQRAIAEADIIQLDGGRLYALSKSGTASIVDVSVPGTLELLGQTNLPGTPFEMYRRGDSLIVMSNAAVAGDGNLVSTTSSTTQADQGRGALVTVLDVRDPAVLQRVATLKVPGEVADSRIVGDVLYLATYENVACYGCGTAPRTMVTTFDLRRPEAIAQVEQVSFSSNAPDGYNLPWGTNWKRSIFVTPQRLYIGGHADVEPTQFGAANEGIIDVVDVSDPRGRLKVGARLTVAGAILSRWQLEEREGILRVISQQGAGRTGNGIGSPEVDTFRVESSTSFVPLGHMTMRLPRQEGLRAVRFDAKRAYAITYNQTDPLFVIDLADPARPVQRGELLMPGFMYHLEPHGDRVIGLGIDRTDPAGSLNVSLFDVANADHPKMLARVPFAVPHISEDYAILDGEIAEDQDRIQKAFRVLSDGVVVVPFSAPQPYYAPSGQACDNNGGGVQLVEWENDTLVRRALLPVPGNPRRAFQNGAELVTVSDSNVRTFSMGNLAVAHQTADLVIGTCVPDSTPYYGGFEGGGYYDNRYGHGCSAAPGRPSGSELGSEGILLALAALMLARLRRPASFR